MDDNQVKAHPRVLLNRKTRTVPGAERYTKEGGYDDNNSKNKVKDVDCVVIIDESEEDKIIVYDKNKKTASK